jgi:hypothetical protein
MTQNSSTTAIIVSHLKKTYVKVTAVEDMSFMVNEGGIFGNFEFFHYMRCFLQTKTDPL